MNSKLFQLNTRDFLKGLIVAVIGAILTGLYNLIENGLDFTWPHIKAILITGILAGLSYLTTTLTTNSERKFFTPEVP